MAKATSNLQTAPGHQVLAAAGKTLLRPGGIAATEQLWNWAGFEAGETVLELASSFGESAIAMAKRFGVRVVGVEKNPDSVARSRENIKSARLDHQIEIIEGDIFNLGAIDRQFDYVLAEAILTMQSVPGKKKLLSDIRHRLKPGGKFLSQEMLARDNEAQLHQLLSQVIRVNATPQSPAAWQQMYENASFEVQHFQARKMGLLNVGQLVRDEGLANTIRIARNLLANPELRSRVLEMRRTFLQHQDELGTLIVCAIAV